MLIKAFSAFQAMGLVSLSLTWFLHCLAVSVAAGRTGFMCIITCHRDVLYKRHGASEIVDIDIACETLGFTVPDEYSEFIDCHSWSDYRRAEIVWNFVCWLLYCQNQTFFCWRLAIFVEVFSICSIFDSNMIDEIILCITKARVAVARGLTHHQSAVVWSVHAATNDNKLTKCFFLFADSNYDER